MRACGILSRNGLKSKVCWWAKSVFWPCHVDVK
jgi:hypothetical protein